jgi:hypothetical protein
MGTERRKQVLLAALLIALVVVVYRALTATPASPDAPAAATGSRSTAQARATQGVTTPEVDLGKLNGERPKPLDNDRNLFRFKPKPPPPPPPSMRPTAPTMTAPPVPAMPPGPPPPPAITLKFIGVIEQGAGKPKIAVLSDGQGPPLYGFEGGTVAGRYRILRIGVESIELAYLDGRGRQTIRLTGS